MYQNRVSGCGISGEMISATTFLRGGFFKCVASAIRFSEGATVKWISPTAIALNILGLIASKFNAAVKPACRYPPTAGRANAAYPSCSFIEKGDKKSPPRWGGGTAALNFEATKPRIFNAIAVGEIHLTVAPSPKRIADATHLKSHHAKTWWLK